MTVQQHTDAELARLYRDLDAVDLTPLWTITEELLTPTPRPKARPWLWRAEVYRALAERAIEFVPIERGGERRVLSLRNPGLAGRPYVAGTLWGGIQCLGPHESAPAHRHSPGAIRFVLEGEGVSTTVNGDACDMRAGDLVLTPSMNWHDHLNSTDRNMLWFDGLDVPLVLALDAIFFEPHPEANQQVLARNDSERRFGGRAAHTSGVVHDVLDPTHSPLLIYRWTDTDARLDAEAAARPEQPSVSVEYVNPRSGGSVLPTLACGMQRVFAGRTTSGVRRAGNWTFVVRDGAGHSIIDGRRFDWATGDMFVVPSWSAVEHHADRRSDLFTLSDSPVLRALGLYREQPLDAPQQVTGVFTPR
ncbi:cupin domain-containing protein [Pseudonocardia spinosispora]|uniref:cupin domain-containing protein n=1 Tax=Pseudonocardia spinosispora TaxID=103441 RepID=UPI0003FB56B0|nr:cupin domain-containing protein [Pseudonocardia spinosispora]